MVQEFISPSDEYVLTIGLSGAKPGCLIFRIDDAITRDPVAWVHLSPDRALKAIGGIAKLLGDLHGAGASGSVGGAGVGGAGASGSVGGAGVGSAGASGSVGGAGVGGAGASGSVGGAGVGGAGASGSR